MNKAPLNSSCPPPDYASITPDCCALHAAFPSPIFLRNPAQHYGRSVPMTTPCRARSGQSCAEIHRSQSRIKRSCPLFPPPSITGHTLVSHKSDGSRHARASSTRFFKPYRQPPENGVADRAELQNVDILSRFHGGDLFFLPATAPESSAQHTGLNASTGPSIHVSQQSSPRNKAMSGTPGDPPALRNLKTLQRRTRGRPSTRLALPRSIKSRNDMSIETSRSRFGDNLARISLLLRCSKEISLIRLDPANRG